MRLVKDWINGGFDVAAGELVLLENVRFNKGEKKNVDETAQKYAKLCDVFVMDAFGTAHRAEGSTHGVAKFAPVACAGILLTEELDALTKALLNPKRPMVAIVGGSKVSTKLTVLESLSEKVDQLVVGGGIANTFLAASGKKIGKSLAEADLIPTAKTLMEKMTKRGATIPIAVDVVVRQEVRRQRTGGAEGRRRRGRRRHDLRHRPEERAATRRHHHEGRHRGVERPGRRVRVRPVRRRHQDDRRWPSPSTSAFTLAGGGDTIAAIQKYDIYDKVSYISTAGGAFLEFLEGKKLPAVAMLEERAKKISQRKPPATAGWFAQGFYLLRRTKIVATLGPATEDPKVSG